MVHPGGLLALRLALRAVAKATLSFLVPAVNSATSSISSLLKISENMVHPGGFEPPTARFVAEYSIQLSYGCIGKFILLLILIPLLKPYQVRDGASGRITRLAARPLFSVEILRRTPLTRRRVCRCSVSVVAHYRELFRPDKRKI